MRHIAIFLAILAVSLSAHAGRKVTPHITRVAA